MVENSGNGPSEGVAVASERDEVSRRIERVRRIAERAARRLYESRPAGSVAPATPVDLLNLIELMAATPKKYGVTLMPWELKALRFWNRYQRLMLAQAHAE